MNEKLPIDKSKKLLFEQCHGFAKMALAEDIDGSKKAFHLWQDFVKVITVMGWKDEYTEYRRTMK